METENRQKVYGLLREMGIPFSVEEHPPVYTIEEMQKLSIGGGEGEIVKNLFLRDNKGRRHFLVVLQQDKKADLKALRQLIQSTPLSFASEERLMKYLGLAKGAVTPLGIIHDSQHQVEVLLDEDLQSASRIGVHPNDNTATLWLSWDDLIGFITRMGNPLRLIRL